MRQDTKLVTPQKRQNVYQLPMRQDTVDDNVYALTLFYQLPMRQDTTTKLKNRLNLQ